MNNTTTETVTLDGDILEEADLLLEVVKFLVLNPNDARVESTQENEGVTMLSIHVHQEDRGHIIGKEGRTIEALRHLFHKGGTIDQKKLHVRLAGSDSPDHSKKRPFRRNTTKQAN